VGGIWPAVAVGFVSGVLSGAFGVGGGLVTTPAVRLLLLRPALVAVGTPLPVIIPGALVGALTHARHGNADVRLGLALGMWGVGGSLVGAWCSSLVGGRAVMLVTAVFVAWVALDIARGDSRARVVEGVPQGETPPGHLGIAALGMLAGLYSGFLGLGGGFVIVPGLTRWFGVPMKRAVGTSLVTVAVLAVPGTIAHQLLGHIDGRLALQLAAGVVPGALLGARLTLAARERSVRSGFGVMMFATALWLAFGELSAGAR